MSDSDLQFIPGSVTIGSLEIVTLAFDMSPLLKQGDTVTGLDPILTREANDEDVSDTSIIGTPTVTGTTAKVTVGALDPETKYILTVSFVPNVGQKLSPYLVIDCPR